MGWRSGRCWRRLRWRLERQLPGLEWVHLVESPEQLRAFLPQLTEIFQQNRILLVLDNIESLLTGNGEWRDERWAWVLARADRATAGCRGWW